MDKDIKKSVEKVGKHLERISPGGVFPPERGGGFVGQRDGLSRFAKLGRGYAQAAPKKLHGVRTCGVFSGHELGHFSVEL